MNEWDPNASQRYRQISTGVDLSYLHVLMPAILANLPQPTGHRASSILDAGCGPGVLANKLHEIGWNVVGIDPSPAMISVAKEHSAFPGPRFMLGQFLDFPSIFPPRSFDAVVANMSITSILDLQPVFRAVSYLLRPNAIFVLSDVHPFFWRYHKGHANISYWTTAAITEPLTIGLDPDPLPAPTTVVFRPLEALCLPLEKAGFRILRFTEPRPPADVEQQRPDAWRFPRFIVIAAEPSTVSS